MINEPSLLNLLSNTQATKRSNCPLPSRVSIPVRTSHFPSANAQIYIVILFVLVLVSSSIAFLACHI
ncbi:hypothetical protein GE21DRAFT_1034991 [Neurospora crassa]|nr:hypothetical protein GE21DRAFT_1034991 [Neurospora crassa]